MNKFLLRLAVVLGFLAIAGGAGFFWWLTGVPGRAMQAFAKSLEADYEQQLSVFMSVNRLTPHMKLVVAELDETVSGRLVSEKTWLGIDLGDTSVDYRIPVKFFYAIDLSGPAPIDVKVDVEARTVVARFPELVLLAAEPDLARAEKRLAVGWGRFSAYSGQFVLQELDRELLPRLKAEAALAPKLAFVRETARKQLAEFVTTYLLSQQVWGEAGFQAVEVRFADEASTSRIVTIERP